MFATAFFRCLALPMAGVSFAAICTAGILNIDFSHGAPSSSVIGITPITPGTTVDYSGGKLNIGISNAGDGIIFDVVGIHARCTGLDGLDLTGFDTGAGVFFGVETGDPTDPSIIGASIIESDSVTLKIQKETAGIGAIRRGAPLHFETLATVEFPNVALANFANWHLDWIKAAVSGKDSVRVTLTKADGSKLFKDIDTPDGLKHMDDPNDRTKGIVVGVDQVLVEPTVSVESMSLDTEHAPEPSTWTLLAGGLIALGVWRRPPGLHLTRLRGK